MALQGILSSADPGGLQGCWDYITFPLLLIVDSISALHLQRPPHPTPAAAAVAGEYRGSSNNGGSDASDTPVPAAASDRVCEAVLGECVGRACGQGVWAGCVGRVCGRCVWPLCVAAVCGRNITGPQVEGKEYIHEA